MIIGRNDMMYCLKIKGHLVAGHGHFAGYGKLIVTVFTFDNFAQKFSVAFHQGYFAGITALENNPAL